MKSLKRTILVAVLVVAVWTAIEFFFLGTLQTASTGLRPWWWYAGFAATFIVVSAAAGYVENRRAAGKK